MARPRTIVVVDRPDAQYIQETSQRLQERVEQDVVIMDSSAVGREGLMLQAAETASRDPVAVTLLAAVVGGIGATLGEIVIEQTIRSET